MDTQRYDELLENGTITQEEYDKLTTVTPEPKPEDEPKPDEPKPITGSFFEDYIHNLNGDELK